MAASVCDDDGDDASVCPGTSMMGLATGETRWAGGGIQHRAMLFLFDIWIGNMCLMCLVNELGEISPILGPGQHSGVNIGPNHFLGFTVMDWF